jgi:hypothetical protein
LNELLLDGLHIAGRRPGLELTWEGDFEPYPRVRAGVFQGSTIEGVLPDFGEPLAVGAVLRLEVGQEPIELGASAEWRAVQLSLDRPGQRFWAAEVDGTIDREWSNWALRVWGEGWLGTSWWDEEPLSHPLAVFAAGRAIVAMRHGGLEKDEWYVEPFAMGSLFEPNTGVRDDLIYELVAGVNVGIWKRLRLGVSGQWSRGSRNTPVLLSASSPVLLLGRSIIAQLGGVF